MFSLNRLIRTQWALLAVAVLLALAYASVFRPLAGHALALDKPLKESWKRLTDAADRRVPYATADPNELADHVRELEASLLLTQQASRLARDRILLDPDIRKRMSEPFQLLEFDSRRLEMMSELRRLAESSQVTLEAKVFAGFPQYESGLAKAPLLWAQLSLVGQLLRTAVAQQPRVIKSVVLLPSRSYTLPETGTGPYLEEFPMRLELVGSIEAVQRFVSSLPLRGAELKEQGHREVSGKNQALFLDRLLLRNTTNSPTELHLEAVLCGFAATDQ